MVKQIKCAAALIVASAFFLVGCNNLIGGTVSGTGSSGSNSIVVSLNEVDHSRSLAPATLTNASAEISYYAITGESTEGFTFAYKATATNADPAIALNDNKILPTAFNSNGTVTLEDVNVDDWTFTMYAYNSSGNIILKGTSVCNLKSANQTSVSFTLSSFDLDATGGYNITMKYTGSSWVNTYTVKYGLYSTVDGTVKYGTTDLAAATAADIATDTGKSVASDSIEPGSYVFGVGVYSGTTRLAYASDLLIIEPGRTTTADFEIGDIIMSAPNAPTGLAAQWIEDSQDEDYYNVRIYWTDASTNETSFKLLVKEFTDTKTTTWDALTASAAKDFVTNSTAGTYAVPWNTLLTLDGSSATSSTYPFRYVAGSLYAGSTEVILKFPTGRLFDVQIYAINDIGNSAACARAADAAASGTLAYSSSTASASLSTTIAELNAEKVTGYSITSTVNSVATVDHISLVRTSYDLEGGTLTLAAGDSFSGSTYVTYAPYKLDTTAASDEYKYQSLLTIATSDSGSYPTLVKSNTDMTKWVAYVSRVETDVEYNINAYKNITVSAVYGETSADVSVTGLTIDALPTLDDGKISVFYGTNATTANATTIPSGGITVARGEDPKYITVTVAAPGTGETSFAKYKLYINGNYKEEITASATAAVSFTNISTSKLNNGVDNEIMVVGVTATGQEASAKVSVLLHN